jgi:RHS repeat-associated protein
LAYSLGEDQPFRYRGYVYDSDTQLYYLQSRYYDPKIGRFISADVLLSTGQGVIGYNSFAYCGNNPVKRFDPAGNSFISDFTDWIGDGLDYLIGQTQNVTSKINTQYYIRPITVVPAAVGVCAAVSYVGPAVIGTLAALLSGTPALLPA